jgi:hypothetical protein
MLRLELDYEGGVVNFPVDHARSFIEGVIVADEPDAVLWDITIECNEALVPPRPEDKHEDDPDYAGYPEDCNLELSGLTFPLAGWRELSGKASEVSFVADEVHPILPDNPGNFYFDSCHHVPNDNRVRFGSRAGVWFAVEWECVARAYAEDEGSRIAVNTRLPLRQFQVWFREPGSVSLEVAKQLVLRFAQPGDIGEPVQRTPQWVVVPVRSEAE